MFISNDKRVGSQIGGMSAEDDDSWWERNLLKYYILGSSSSEIIDTRWYDGTRWRRTNSSFLFHDEQNNILRRDEFTLEGVR
jgi:hypothetical protein